MAASAVLTLGTVACLVPTASADDKLHHRQKQVHRQIQLVQSEAEDTSKAVRQAQAALAASQADLAAAQQHLVAAQQALLAAQQADVAAQLALQAAEQKVADAQQALATAKARVVEQRRQIGVMAANDYANGDPGMMRLQVLFRTQNPAQATAQLGAVDSVMSSQTVTLDSLRQARHAQAVQEAALEQARVSVAAQRKAAAEHLVTTQGLTLAAQQAEQQVQDLVVRNQAAENAAIAAHRADQAQLNALHRQENRIKQLIIERARRAHGGYSGNTNGFLYPPVPGPVTSPFGWRIHPIYHYWGLHDGTDFAAGCGDPLHAGGDGTVIAEDWSSVYGNRLYLDLGRVNGHDMTLVYNHATSYSVGVGGHVVRGQSLGAVGTTGWSTGCHLHFTVLLDGNPVNPMTYM